MKYATVSWTIEDVQSLRPDWSDERCEEFLVNNENDIADRLVELGWEVLQDLITNEEVEELSKGE